MQIPPESTATDYKIVWICALPAEMAASLAMSDEQYESSTGRRGEQLDGYFFGRIGKHRVVLACLPAGIYGTTSAAVVGAQIQAEFPSVRFALMVGIGGGVPSAEHDIRLGDVVVSKPKGGSGGVVQYDFGKTIASGQFVCHGALNKPPRELLAAVARLEALNLAHGNAVTDHLAEMMRRFPHMREKFCYQGQEHDLLFASRYPHAPGPLNLRCDQCDRTELVNRPFRTSNDPIIHHGTIASGNQVIKNAVFRDQLHQEHDISCFEMEAAGLMDHFPCLVIRGVCDYADSHKSKRWQEYAAATAAAYAKTLLAVLPENLGSEQSINPGEQNQTGVRSPSPSTETTSAASLPSPSSIFQYTSALCDKEDVQLGSFILNPRYPNQDALAGGGH